MEKPWFVLSPCGTSLLTNAAGDKTVRDLLNQYTNAPDEKSVAEEDRSHLEEVLEIAGKRLEKADAVAAAELSAELRGLISLYQERGRSLKCPDFHQILATDTWLGGKTAEMVKQWLERQGAVATIYRPRDLRTAELEEFQLALSEVVTALAQTMPGYRASHHVIFNLTGGFKGIQGFLQTLAAFYADETVYIFQTGRALLRIPRLPVRLDAQETAREHALAFRKMALGLGGAESEVAAIPETLVNRIGGEVDLSPWGRLIWEEAKRDLYRDRLWPVPTPKLRYQPRFEADVKALPPERVALVNERVDALARHLEKRANVSSLDFKKLKGNPLPPSYPFSHEGLFAIAIGIAVAFGIGSLSVTMRCGR